jgi:pyruvate/2-oxoglutarate/acetoin dehydrogenase E1 component
MANEGRRRKLSAILSADVKDYSRLMSRAVSNMANYAIQVADELKNKISVEVIDPRTIAPLDIDTILESVKKTGRLVVVNEDVEVCGITAEICMHVIERGFDFIDAPPRRVAAANMPIPGGVLEQYALPQLADIREAIEKTCNI